MAEAAFAEAARWVERGLGPEAAAAAALAAEEAGDDVELGRQMAKEIAEEMGWGESLGCCLEMLGSKKKSISKLKDVQHRVGIQ